MTASRPSIVEAAHANQPSRFASVSGRRHGLTARRFGALAAAALLVGATACTTGGSDSVVSRPGEQGGPGIPAELGLLEEPILEFTRIDTISASGVDDRSEETVTVDLDAGIILRDGGELDSTLVRTPSSTYRSSSSAECGPWIVLGEEQLRYELGGSGPLDVEPLEVVRSADDLSQPTVGVDGTLVYETSVPARMALRGVTIASDEAHAAARALRSPLTVIAAPDGSRIEITIDASELFRVLASGMVPDYEAEVRWIVVPRSSTTPLTIPADAVDDAKCQRTFFRPTEVKPPPETTTPP